MMDRIGGRLAFMRIKEDRALQRIRRSIDAANHDRLLSIRDSQDAELNALLRAIGDAVIEIEGQLADETLEMIAAVMAGIAVPMPAHAGDMIEASHTAWKLLVTLDDERFIDRIVARGRFGLLRTTCEVILALKSWLLVSEAVLDRLTWQSWTLGFLSNGDRSMTDRYTTKRPDEPPAS